MKGGHRAMDILHLATTKHLGLKRFLTFDGNQKTLAEAEGLVVPVWRVIPMSFGNPTFVQFIVGRASRLPLKGLRSQAGHPRTIQKSKSKLPLV
jgi:hypothetical protein